jgi:RNA polymerase sigma-70 factor (ECF subfamily)
MNDGAVNLATLGARFFARLVIFGRRRLGSRAAAEDLAQETLRRVVEAHNEGRIRDPAALGAFVYEIARHVIQQHFRRNQREQRAFGKLERDEADSGSTPLADVISEQRRGQVRKALEQLDEPDRRLLTWIYHEELDPADAAARLGIEPGTLRVRKHRALQRLGTLLGEESPVPESFSPRRETHRPQREPEGS